MTTESRVIDQDWLAISTDGFEQQNSARPPAHRAKELIQNSMDAFGGGKGEIHLTFTPGRTGSLICTTMMGSLTHMRRASSV
jgi:hypothetical protein